MAPQIETMRVWRRRFVRMEGADKTRILCHSKRASRARLNNCKVELWKQKFRARPPSKMSTWSCDQEAWTVSSTAGMTRAWSDHDRDRPGPVVRQTFPICLPRHVLYCKTQQFAHPLSLKNACRANILTNWKSKMWKRSFRSRLPSRSDSSRCENESFVREFLQKLKVEPLCCEIVLQWEFFAVRLLCYETSLLRGFFDVRRLCYETSLLGCEASLLRDVFAVSLLCCETSLLWDFFAARRLCCEASLLWDFFAVRHLCCETSLLWDFFAVLCYEASLLWGFFAMRLLCCEASLLRDVFAMRLRFLSAVRLLCCEPSLLCDAFAVRFLCCEISLLWVPLLWDFFALKLLIEKASKIYIDFYVSLVSRSSAETGIKFFSRDVCEDLAE